MTDHVLYFLKSVLGVETVMAPPGGFPPSPEMTSPHPIDRGVSSAAVTPLGPVQTFGPAQSSFGFALPMTLSPQRTARGEFTRGWRSLLGEADGTVMEKMILATGHAPESIRLIFVDEDRLAELGPADLERHLSGADRWIVMGTSLVSLLWQNKPITSVRGQVLTRGTTYLWPTWGLWEMHANGALKREVWADMKRAFQGFIIESPGNRPSAR